MAARGDHFRLHETFVRRTGGGERRQPIVGRVVRRVAVGERADGGHAALLQITSELDALFEALEAALKNTDLYLGFNSLDGD